MDNKIAKIVVVEKDNTAKALIQSYLVDVENIDVMNAFSSLDEAYKFIMENKPDVLILDMDGDVDKILESVSSILKENAQCKIIATSYNKNTSSIIKTMRAGAKEFLLKPILKNELIKSIEDLSNIQNNDSEYSAGYVISVFSNKGGVGKTSVAVNVAAELANITKEKVALVDLNFQLGDVATFLDIVPKFDIPHILDNVEKADENYLYNMLVQYNSTNLYVLADLPQNDYVQNVTPLQIENLLKKLKQHFAYVIIDSTSSIDDKTLAALSLSNAVFIISNINVPSLHNCQRCMNLFNKFNYDSSKVKIILNRYIDNDEISLKDVESALNKKVFWQIPNNYIVQMSAINRGVTVSEVNPGANIAQSYKDLASNISEKLF